MTCEQWRESASEYIEGTLGASAQQVMETHLRGCASCQADEAALRAVCRELNVLPSVDPPLFFRENVLAAIEREQKAKAEKGWWRRLSHLGKVAGATALAGGAIGAVAVAVYLPTLQKQNANSTPIARGDLTSGSSRLLPGADAQAHDVLPRLRITRASTMIAGRGPAFSFSVWLENAEHGMARFRLIGDEQDYRFDLTSNTPRTLQVPFSVTGENKTLDLQVFWTADGQSHTRHLFVPVPRANNKDAEARQSFGLPTGDVASVAREIAARYNVPVTVEDAPASTDIQVTARDETALETLQRQITTRGLRVSESQAGLLIENAPANTEPAKAPAVP